MFHGAIEPKSIYLDTDNTVKIGNLLYSREIFWFEFYFKEWGLFSGLLNKKFVAPEISLLQGCIRKGVFIKPFDPEKSDVFSIGLLILWVYNKLQGNLNLLEIDISECEDKFVIKSNNYYYKSKLLEEINNISFAIKESIETFAENNKIKKLLTNALSVFYSKRSECRDLLIFFKDDDEIFKEKDGYNNNVMDLFKGNATDFESFEKIIIMFNRIINCLPSAKISLEKFKMLVSSELEEFNLLFNKAFDSYYDSPIEESIKIVDGIVVFVHSILYQLFNGETLKNFRMLMDLNGEIEYKLAIYKIMERPPDFRHYLVSGLLHLNIIKGDWGYFFTNYYENELDIACLTEYPIIIDKFMKVFTSNIMKNIFRDHYKISKLIPLLEKTVFPNTFLIETQPSINRMTSYDMVIYIKLKYYFFTNSISLHGAVLAIIIHELAHFLTRTKLKTRRDVRNSMTSNLEDSEFHYYNNPVPTPENKNCDGFRLEYQLFGCQLTRITKKSAEVLLKLDQYDSIKRFRKDFFNENRNSLDFESITKETEELRGIRCSFMN